MKWLMSDYETVIFIVIVVAVAGLAAARPRREPRQELARKDKLWRAIAIADARRLVAGMVAVRPSGGDGQMDLKSVLRGEVIRVSGGDFRAGAVTIRDECIKLRTRDGKRLIVPFGAIVAIERIDAEKRTTTGDRLKGLVGGGVVGGTATGALVGGLAASGVAGAAVAGALGGVLTGPVGMALGAAAGTVYAVIRTFITCRVELRCGLSFTGEAQEKMWNALKYIVARSPAAQAMDAPPSLPSSRSLPMGKIASAIPSLRKRRET